MEETDLKNLDHLSTNRTTACLLADIRRLMTCSFNVDDKVNPKDCSRIFNVDYLLSISIGIRAVEEGLFLLEKLAIKDCPCGVHDLNPENGCSPESYSFFDKIADFALNVAGWDACSKAVLQIISQYELITDFISLAENLYRRNCFNGAVEVLREILQAITQTRERNASNNTYPTYLLARSIILLNQFESAATVLHSADQIVQLKNCLKQLEPLHLWNELSVLLQHVKGEGVVDEVFADVAPFVVDLEVKHMEAFCFSQFLKACLQCRNTNLIEKLWNKVLDELSLHTIDNFSLLHRIVIITRTNVERVELLKTMIDVPNAPKILDKLVSVCFKNYLLSENSTEHLIPYLLFVCLAEFKQKLRSKGTNRLESFCSCLLELTTEDLLKVLSEFYSKEKTFIKTKTASTKIFRPLLKNLLNRDVIQLAQSTSSTFVNIFEYYLWLQDKKLIEAFVQRIVQTRNARIYDIEYLKVIYLNVPKLVDIPGIYGESPNSTNGKLDKRCMLLLLDAWIRSSLTLLQLDFQFIEDHSLISTIYVAQMRVRKYMGSADEIGTLHSMLVLLIIKLSFNSAVEVAKNVLSEIKQEDPNLKYTKSCLTNFRVLILDLISRSDFQQLFPVKPVVDDRGLAIAKGLFWIGDEEALEKLRLTIFSGTTSDPLSYVWVDALIFSTEIQEYAKKSWIAFKYFQYLVHHYKQVLICEISKKAHTYAMPHVKSAVSEIQAFLSEDVEFRSFGPFKSEKEAKSFVSKAKITPRDDLVHRVVTSGDKIHFHCLLIKAKKTVVFSDYYEKCESALDKVVTIEKLVSDHFNEGQRETENTAHSVLQKNASSNNVESPPPPKTLKIEVIDVD